jgi:hypothetical protein
MATPVFYDNGEQILTGLLRRTEGTRDAYQNLKAAPSSHHSAVRQLDLQRHEA